MKLDYLQISIGAAAMLFAWYIIHRMIRKFQRRCSQCGSLRVKRWHRMEDNDEANDQRREGLHKHIFHYNQCKGCGHFWGGSEDKCLTSVSLEWKRVFHPKDFELDLDSRERAFGQSRRFIVAKSKVLTLKVPKHPLNFN